MNIVGIDLGTTNSACAVWRDGKVRMIPNRLGETLTPSVVHIGEDGKATVGKIAKEKLITQPDCTTSLFKRYMGTDRKIKVNGKGYSSSELSALVLISLKEDAEVFLDEAVVEVVVSVPAYFNDIQRKATVLAAQMAGLIVKRLVSEPTAAAIAYGLHERPEHTHFMVIDLGGGTFDVSIMEYFDDVLEVHASAGDSFLGGEDFLQLLVKMYLDSINSNSQDLTRSELNQVYQQMELAKRDINSNDRLLIPPFLERYNQPIELTYNDFEKNSEPLLQRIQGPVEKALRDANLTPSDLDDVLLVGGATRMKVLRSAVVKMFRRIPSANLNPDEVVAMGAGIQAGLVSRDAALDDVVLTDVSPYSLGIAVLNENDKTGLIGSLFDPIIERNTTVPVSREEVYSTVSDNQSEIVVVIYQGENRLVQNNIQLGKLEVRVSKKKAGEESIVVRFSYDVNGLLEVDVHVTSTGERLNRTIQNAAGSLSDKEMRISQEKLAKLKFHPRDEELNRELVARADRLYEGLINEERSIIRDCLLQFEAILETQDEKRIEQGRSELESVLEHFDQSLF